ncbi:MAG: beta-glucosidase, partial [Acidobacteriaceae bacterium]
MNRRQFLNNSVAAAGAALLGERRLAAAEHETTEAPAASPAQAGESGGATFPDGFLWGIATSAFQV